MNQRFDRPGDQASRQNARSHPIRYFVPGQLFLHVDHPHEMDSGVLVQAITDFLNEQKEDHREWKKQIVLPKPEYVITFSRREDQESDFSLLLVELPKARASDQQLFELINGWNSRFHDTSIPLNITLRAASPNWLVGGTPGQSTTGGPGGWPSPADPPAEDGWKFQFQNREGVLSSISPSDGQGKGIHVAILDTAPTQHDRDRAYAEWRWQHKLLESLLGPKSPLTVYPASSADLAQTQDYDLYHHQYLMRDHGLFIAGIIHTIAPQATLHLYEVLNPYGVGSLDTVARGLQRMLNNPAIKDNPLIINCSFMLGIPVKRNGEFDWKFDPLFPDVWRDPGVLERMTLSAKEVFGLLAKRKNTIVIAGAGNDAHDDNNTSIHIRPDARYPAAFDTVIGVGALPKAPVQTSGQYTAASYSNLSDNPAKGSYITLGGEPGSEQGILGIYIGDFPRYEDPEGCLSFLWRMLTLSPKQQSADVPWKRGPIQSKYIKYRRNLTGWAWWAGTSFATPIISGILAANYNQPGFLASNVDQVGAEGLLNSRLEGDQTDQNERVIGVIQGP